MAIADLRTRAAPEPATINAPTSDLEALGGLRGRLRGDVLTPHDPAYADVRAPFNAMYPGRPALVARANGTADVVSAVCFAHERDLLLAVRGGGHSVAGLSSVDGGMLLDLALMNEVVVEPDARVAHVQGGALWGDVDRETQRFGLVAPGGVVSDTAARRDQGALRPGQLLPPQQQRRPCLVRRRPA